MVDQAKKVIGIEKGIEVELTGATANFHKITFYGVDLISKVVNVTIASFISKQKAAEGKQSVGSISVTVQIASTDTVTEEYLYQKVAAGPANDPHNQSYLFAGATLVTE